MVDKKVAKLVEILVPWMVDESAFQTASLLVDAMDDLFVVKLE